MENKTAFQEPGKMNEEEETLEQRWNRMVYETQCRRGCSPHEAKRFLNAISRRQLKKKRPKNNKKARQVLKRYTI